MVGVKSVKIDGEDIFFFNSALYIFESSHGYTLQLDMIVTEVLFKKYRKLDNLILEIALEDGRLIDSIMKLKTLPGGLPQLNLYCDLDSVDEYEGFSRLNEYDIAFPNIEEGITLEDIRKVEMPDEELKLKIKLPIDQVEWISKQKKGSLNEIFKEMIYEYWKKQA